MKKISKNDAVYNAEVRLITMKNSQIDSLYLIHLTSSKEMSKVVCTTRQQ